MNKNESSTSELGGNASLHLSSTWACVCRLCMNMRLVHIWWTCLDVHWEQTISTKFITTLHKALDLWLCCHFFRFWLFWFPISANPSAKQPTNTPYHDMLQCLWWLASRPRSTPETSKIPWSANNLLIKQLAHTNKKQHKRWLFKQLHSKTYHPFKC